MQLHYCRFTVIVWQCETPSVSHYAGKLFQQYVVVDTYVKTEASRLDYIH